jgi:hypothetical protein
MLQDVIDVCEFTGNFKIFLTWSWYVYIKAHVLRDHVCAPYNPTEKKKDVKFDSNYCRHETPGKSASRHNGFGLNQLCNR